MQRRPSSIVFFEFHDTSICDDCYLCRTTRISSRLNCVMIPIRSNLLSYVSGGIVVIWGVFMLILPTFIIAGISDLGISPISIPVLIVGAVLGLPAIATGVALTQKRYRLTLFLAVLTEIAYIVTPIVLFQSLSLPYSLPAAIGFIAILLGLMVASMAAVIEWYDRIAGNV